MPNMPRSAHKKVLSGVQHCYLGGMLFLLPNCLTDSVKHHLKTSSEYCIVRVCCVSAKLKGTSTGVFKKSQKCTQLKETFQSRRAVHSWMVWIVTALVKCKHKNAFCYKRLKQKNLKKEWLKGMSFKPSLGYCMPTLIFFQFKEITVALKRIGNSFCHIQRICV